MFPCWLFLEYTEPRQESLGDNWVKMFNGLWRSFTRVDPSFKCQTPSFFTTQLFYFTSRSTGILNFPARANDANLIDLNLSKNNFKKTG